MRLQNIARCALFSALLCICAWIGIPFGDGVVTLQTFALFLTLNLLGGKEGCLVCLVYLLLGAVGLPVFSGFRGGVGMLLGTTGGFLWGFFLGCLVFWGITALLGRGFLPRLFGCIFCCLTCYGCGCLWYVAVYVQTFPTLWTAVTACVLPYVIPDSIKLALALFVSARLHRLIPA